MKVKNASYLRSLTALLRSNVKNFLDPHERCEPWCVTVPSVTYIWTRRPQWRRRHKNLKKSKSPIFPISSMNSRINEKELLDTFKIVERPISRSSASPYETCSSRQIVEESELSRNYHSEQPELFNFSLKQQDQKIDRCGSVSESLSDSGLRKSGETQMIRLIRSQKRLGKRNSANDQASSGTFSSSSQEINRSIRSSIERQFQSDCSIQKRHVTFDNYVSENLVTDTSKSHKSSTMNDSEACEYSHRWQENYAQFTDDEDSLQSDLSRFFPSIIFDVSKSSISLTSSENSERVKKTENIPKRECSESIFYVNSSYSKKSTRDLLSTKKIHSNENYQEYDESTPNADNIGKEELEITKLFIQKETNLLNLQIVPEKEIKEIVTDYCDIDCINVELRNVTSNEKEFFIESGGNFDKGAIYSSSYKNHISTDTSDLNHSIELNHISSLSPIDELSKNDSDRAGLNFSELIDFLQRPRDQMDEIILEELTRVGTKNLANYEEKSKNEDMKKPEISNLSENWNKRVEKVDLLRIDAETYGEYESVFIEMKDLDDSFGEENILEKSSSLKISKCSPKPRESLTVNLPKDGKKFPPITSTGSNFSNGHVKCTGVDKCCSICGRNQTDNPRYLRPVCRVKGVNPTLRLENDPWNNVMKKVIKHEHGKELNSPQKSSKNEEGSHQELLVPLKDEISNDESLINTILPITENESENIEKAEEECFSVIIAETENSLPSILTENSNILSSRDDSTSCSPEADLISSGSFDLATSARMQSSGKSYYTRESVRSVDCTANRLLCVISESDSLMSLPQFLPKKPPDWFGRQVTRRKWSRR